ncbi:MAG TPA: hypothetical protein QF353_02540 [Gammaproteobacteria bacterium]|nr:hypothetical protein [Gammaproteobacteria bacterium]
MYHRRLVQVLSAGQAESREEDTTAGVTCDCENNKVLDYYLGTDYDIADRGGLSS